MLGTLAKALAVNLLRIAATATVMSLVTLVVLEPCRGGWWPAGLVILAAPATAILFALPDAPLRRYADNGILAALTVSVVGYLEVRNHVYRPMENCYIETPGYALLLGWILPAIGVALGAVALALWHDLWPRVRRR
jgi:hypothetical protein